jgi:glycogen debranching enzyme
MNDQVASGAVPAGPVGAPAATESDERPQYAPSETGQPYLHEMVTAVSAPAMVLSGTDGQIREEGAHGLYVGDVRALSRLVLTIDGREPVRLHHDLVGGPVNEFQGVAADHREADPQVFVSRRRELNPRGVVEMFSIRSYSPVARSCRAELRVACDFAGIAAVKRGLPCLPWPAQATTGGLLWEIPDRCRTLATGTPFPDVVEAPGGLLSWELSLPPGATATFSVSIEFRENEAISPVGAAAPGKTELLAPRVDGSDHRIVRWVELSVADLSGLRMAAKGHPREVFTAAGAPWYLTLFGRDSLWAARMLLPLGTDLALGTLSALARRQGQSDDPRTAEEPGKILHELRRGSSYDPDASGRRRENFFGLPPVYYGAVDSTPLWACLLHEAWLWGAPEAEIEALLEPLTGCLSWIAERGCDARGFLSYIDRTGKGLANQGWKDSGDAVQYRDGRLAKGPVALCEVQGYAFQAAMGGAEMLDAFGWPGAERWRAFAQGLAERFRGRFWVDDAGGAYPAMALDGEGRPVDSLTSNIGHLLGTGILSAEESELVARRLAGADLASGFGVRTMATTSRGFNPVSYHCGSVWAHDTAIAVLGLARTAAPSAERAAVALVDGLLSAAEGFGYRVPELYGGHDRERLASPVPYPASCHPQAWSAAASVAVLASLLRLQPDIPHGRVHLAPMTAPLGLRSVDGLCVAGQRVSVHLAPDGRADLAGLPAGIEVVAAPA